jgi:monoamine oxidase
MKKLIFLALIFSITSCSVFKRNQSKQVNKKIIVVGAGISGLSAAKYLKKKGFNVIVLEAQEKIGGRTQTDRSLGIAFDKGASWIHGSKRNPISKLVSKSGANTFLTDDDNEKVYNTDGKEYSTIDIYQAESSYNSIVHKLSNSGNINESFGQLFYSNHPQFKNNLLWTYMLSAFLEFDTGGDIYSLSSLDYYNDKAYSGKDLIITNGYDKVIDYLSKNIDIRLNTKVENIDYTKDNIKIETNNGSFEADQVIVTVPLGVLKKNVIKFTPSLPKTTQNAINNLKMGSVNKFLLVWDSSFWDTDLQYIGYTPETKGKFNYFLNVKKYTNTNALMTFAFGDYSKETEEMNDSQITNEIMAHLKSIYGENIPEPSNMLRTKWNSNVYTYGSYSFAPSGTSSNDFRIFEQPINNKIFFAGEHTIFDYRGTVHGAYLSGLREAKKIARQ